MRNATPELLATDRRRQIARTVLLNFAILGAGLVGIELVFGAWLDPESLNRLNLVKDVSLQFDASHLYQTTSPTIHYSRDEYGLRGTFTHPSEIDLLTVGGSTTDQRYISDGETWQDVLQARLNEAGIPTVVVNAGVDGQSTFGHIKNFDWWFRLVPNLRPRRILFYVGLNDFYKEAGFKYDALEPSRSADLVGFRDAIQRNSALWHLARTLRGMYLAKFVHRIGHTSVDFQATNWTRKPLQIDYDFMQPRLEAYKERLHILIAKTRDFGADPVFVSQPARRYRLTPGGLEGHARVTDYDGHRINGVDFYYMKKRLDDAARTVCREENVLFFDLAAESIWEDEDFYDFSHMTPSGTRKVGIHLAEWLASLDEPRDDKR